MGEKALSMAKWNIDEIDFFDLYSCFPSMVELGREALDIPETTSKPLTVTGGLPFFGGAGNNYVSHSIATMMEKLRVNNNSKGLCTSNGWYATIETYTVANGRDGPQMGIVIGRIDANNKRFIAISNDEKTLEIMMTEECLNRDCIVSRNSEGLNIFSI